MLSNYIKITYRTLLKNKVYTSINVLSLAIGLACSIYLIVYIQDELSYDKHHQDYEYMFRVLTEVNGSYGNSAQVAFGDVLNKEYDDIIASRITRNQSVILKVNGKEISHSAIYWADKEIIDVYSIKFVLGGKNALQDKNSVIINESTAHQFFNNENPIGKTIETDGHVYIIQGVFKDLPKNTHAHYNIIFNSFYQFSWAYENGQNPWHSSYPQTYIKIAKHITMEILNERFKAFAKKYVLHLEGIPDGFSYVAQPISEIHFSGRGYDFEENTSYEKLYLLGTVCLMILIIACINFMNLSTARAGSRAKEVGMRKTLGANRKELVYQFLGESLFLTFFAFCIALLFTEIFLPFFNQYFNKSFQSITDFSYVIFLLIAGLYLFVGFVSGLYPAFYLSKYNPVDVLSGHEKQTTSGKIIRKSLVIFQFSITSILIIYALTIVNQIEFMQSAPLGYNIDNLTVINLYDQAFRDKTELLKKELLTSEKITNVTIGRHSPLLFFYTQTLWKEGSTKEDFKMLYSANVDEEFFDTYGIQIIQGRGFSKEYITDKTSAMVLNEKAIKTLGLIGNPIGQTVFRSPPGSENRTAYKIIGIIKDFHSDALSKNIMPLMVRMTTNNASKAYITVKGIDNDINSEIAKAYNTIFPDRYLSSWTSEDLSFKYRDEIRIADFVILFSGIAILISCAGLFGLVSFTAERKTKEIGIRKVLGANMYQLISIFLKEFGSLILLSNLVACPVAIYLSVDWLNNYAYRDEFNMYTLIYALGFSVFIASATIFYQVYKSSTADPVHSLRYE